MPGAITAPLLIAASVYLLVQTRSVRTRFKDKLRYKVAHEVAFGPSGPHFVTLRGPPLAWRVNPPTLACLITSAYL